MLRSGNAFYLKKKIYICIVGLFVLLIVKSVHFVLRYFLTLYILWQAAQRMRLVAMAGFSVVCWTRLLNGTVTEPSTTR